MHRIRSPARWRYCTQFLSGPIDVSAFKWTCGTLITAAHARTEEVLRSYGRYLILHHFTHRQHEGIGKNDEDETRDAYMSRSG